MSQENSSSYLQIIRSTTIMGVASVVNILFRIVRVKVLAVLVGPTGIGLLGIYNSIKDTASAVTGCGLGGSGVRQIAEAQGTNDQKTIISTQMALRWSSVILAVAGAFFLFMLRERISLWTFGDTQQATAIGILSVSVFLFVVGGSQGAFLNGLRRIGDLARIDIISAISGTILVIPVVYIFRESGVVYYVLLTTLASFLTSWYFSSKAWGRSDNFIFSEITQQVKKLLRLGIAFMLSAFMTTGTFYAARILVTRQLGLEATGYFQAAWSISFLYVGFVLEAMTKDFFPRLTALAKDHKAMNQLVNEQAEVALLLSAPIMLAMLSFTPLITYILYSSDFAAANPVLRWHIFGTLFKVLSWPMGFIILAKGHGAIFFITELAWNLLYIIGIWWGIGHLGLQGTGISFFVAYLTYVFIIYFTAHYLSEFNLRPLIIKMVTILSFCFFLILTLSKVSPLFSYIVGSVFTLAFAVYSVRSLHHSVGNKGLTNFIKNIRMKLAPE